MELATFALQLLSLPWSNEEVERVFSQANLVITKLRNRLQIETLNAILSIRFGLRRKGVCCHEYEIPEQYLKMIGSNQSTEIQSLEADNDDIDDNLNELATNKE
nr:uncharacterized protein LOC122321380 [Drosophila bipectinata]